MINAIQIALSGLFSASKRVEASASNIANMTTAGSIDDPDNAPYAALTTSSQTISDAKGQAIGVKTDIVRKNVPFVPAYAPDSPFANEDGIIGAPNVDLAEEAVNLNLAKTAYKASLAVMKTADEMQDELLKSLDKKA